MSNLFDYLTWRNDLTFSKVPCCAVDTLICSCLSYLRLQPVFAKQDMLYVKMCIRDRYYPVSKKDRLDSD